LFRLACLCLVASCGGASIPGPDPDDGGTDGGGQHEAGAEDAGLRHSGSDASDSKADAEGGHAHDECSMGAREACTQTHGDVGERLCTVGVRGNVWGDCLPASCTGTELTCTLEGDAGPGVALCAEGQSASPCGVGGCTPGTTMSDGRGCISFCELGSGVWTWQGPECPPTPLVLSFDRARVEFTRAAGAFDLDGRDVSIETSWVSARTPWLAVDLDGDGRIEDGSELFGSMTRLPDGRRAPNGFAALAALDDDHDGRITRGDAAFDRLLVWSDDDQDRRSAPSELRRAVDVGLVAIHLDYASSARCTDGDCEVERATFEYVDPRGRTVEGDVIDVHLKTR
jgi:hypothetical protein